MQMLGLRTTRAIQISEQVKGITKDRVGLDILLDEFGHEFA